MSHVATYRTAICNANDTFVQAAARLTAQEHGGEMQMNGQVTDYVGRNGQPADYVIKTDRFRYGLGVRSKSGGQLEFVGDLSMPGAKQLMDRFSQHYGIMAMRAAAAETGATFGGMTTLKDGTIELELEVA
jgi:hypothetical protein